MTIVLFGISFTTPLDAWRLRIAPYLAAMAAAAFVGALLRPSQWLWSGLLCGVPAALVALFIFMMFGPVPWPDGYLPWCLTNIALIVVAALGGALAGKHT